MNSRLTITRRALMLSASFPLAAFPLSVLVGVPEAQAQVTINAPDTLASVNTKIATAQTTPPTASTSLTVTKTGVVTGGPGSVTLQYYAPGSGDGALSADIAGTLGAVGATDTPGGAVTDTVGLSMTGPVSFFNPVKTSTGAATIDPTGVVTGGVSLSDFTTSKVDNQGTVYGGIFAQSFGGGSTITSAGTVRTGNVVAQQNSNRVSKTTGGITTETDTNGDATVTVANVAYIDKTGAVLSRGDVTARSYGDGNASATVSGVAGNVRATTTDGAGTFSSVTRTSGGDAAAAGKTVTTSISSETFSKTSKAAVTIGSTGDVLSAFASGTGGGATVTIDGKDAGGATAQALSVDTLAQSTQTEDAGGFTTQTTSTSTDTAQGGATLVAVDAGGLVDGAVLSHSNAGGATSTIGGTAKGSVTSKSQGDATVSTTVTDTTAPSVSGTVTTNHSKTVTTSSDAATGKDALVTVASGGAVGGDAVAQGDGSATISNSAKIAGSATAESARLITTSTSSSTDTTTTADSAAPFQTTSKTVSTSSKTQALAGGAALVDNASGAKIGGNVTVIGATSATLHNAGTIGSAGSPSTVTLTSTTGGPVLTSLTTSSTTANSSPDAKGNFSSSSTGTATGTLQTLGGTATLTNDTSGIIYDPVLTAVGDINITNNGQVLGTTTATSTGSKLDFTATKTSSSTTVGGPPSVTDTSTSLAASGTLTATGGSVTGTYAGLNGSNNFFVADGSIMQTADLNSTATVTGRVNGDVTLDAGQNFGGSGSAKAATTSHLDTTNNNGTDSGSASLSVSGQQTDGTAALTLSGVIAPGASSSGNVSLDGTAAANVALSGNGSIAGNLDASSGRKSLGITASTDYARTTTKGVTVTNSIDASLTTTTSVTEGATSVVLGGKSSVGGDVNAYGVSSSTISVGATSKVGGSVYAETSGDSISDTTTGVYARDAGTGIATATLTTTTIVAPSAADGAATVTVAGTVGGNADTYASNGAATTTVTGLVAGGATADALHWGGSTSDIETSTYAGKSSYSGTGIPGLPGAGLVQTGFTDNYTRTVTGGAATVTIAPTNALVAAGKVEASYVNVEGLTSATATIGAGAIIGGDVTATSAAQNRQYNATEGYTAAGVLDSINVVDARTAVGGTAEIDNAGTIDGNALAFGQGGSTAIINNNGVIKGGFTAVGNTYNNSVETIVTTNITHPALEVITDTTVVTYAAGNAQVTNNGLVYGSGYIQGSTGSLVNNGVLANTVTLGGASNAGTYTTVTTDGAVTNTFAPLATLPTQTYTVAQNGTAWGFNVTGAYQPDPYTGAMVQTSVVNATINLNNGSATLGDITAQETGSGAFATNTVVNLNGSGFLGVDEDYAFGHAPIAPAAADLNPFLVFSQAATPIYCCGNYTIRVDGVTALNKTGAGTFVINGANYVPPAAPGGEPTWTLDVGSFNIKAGEVQLTTPHSDYQQIVTQGNNPVNQFGIMGDVNNSATLVVGRRVPAVLQFVGNSLVTSGQETINGITVRQTGNFTQTSTGNLVVGVDGSLQRFGNVGVDTVGSATEPLGPVTSGVGIPYFTSASNAAFVGATSSSPSRWNITGNLNLAGTVTADVSSNSIYSNGDGYILFTYTGTGTVTATAQSSLASPFVKFGLVQDSTAKTVKLQASRLSYASGATNINAQNAARALDSVVPVIVNRISTDANGGAGFTSVSDIGRAQDAANVISALDWRLNTAQVAEVFDELSSAEIYGSLSAVDQNGVFGQSLDILTERRSAAASGGASSIGAKDKIGASLWLNGAGVFAKYGDNGLGSEGQSPIKSDSFGISGGLDVHYNETGALGIGIGYGRHSIDARGTPETATVDTYTIGAYVTQGFGKWYASARVAYGLSTFDVTRSLALLDRKMTAHFKGHQLDAAVEVGYDFVTGSATLTPFGKLALRDWSMDSFSEQGGGAFGVIVNQASKTLFKPEAGVKFVLNLGDPEGFAVRPFGKLSYTYQDDNGNARTMQYAVGGDAFTLYGVNPKGYGTAEVGVDTTINNRVGLFVSGSYNFAGHNEVGAVRGGLNVNF